MALVLQEQRLRAAMAMRLSSSASFLTPTAKSLGNSRDFLEPWSSKEDRN